MGTRKYGVNGAVCNAALGYVERGWKLVLLGDAIEEGASPERQKNASSKRPRFENWGTPGVWIDNEEKLFNYYERFPKANIGLILGPTNGIIDIEFDSEEGRATSDKYLSGIFTPTYQSGRSIHRLFKWSVDLPNQQKVTKNVGGLEIRIGGGLKQTQSVLPPSWHPGGGQYQWLDGLSPDEVDLQDVPDLIMAWVNNSVDITAADSGKGRGQEFWDKVASGVSEGGGDGVVGRNEAMAAWAGRILATMADLNDATLGIAWDTLAAVNNNNRPPLPTAELMTIFRSITSRETARRAAGGDVGSHGVTQAVISVSQPIPQDVAPEIKQEVARVDKANEKLPEEMTAEDASKQIKKIARSVSQMLNYSLSPKAESIVSKWQLYRHDELPTRYTLKYPGNEGEDESLDLAAEDLDVFTRVERCTTMQGKPRIPDCLIKPWRIVVNVLRSRETVIIADPHRDLRAAVARVIVDRCMSTVHEVSSFKTGGISDSIYGSGAFYELIKDGHSLRYFWLHFDTILNHIIEVHRQVNRPILCDVFGRCGIARHKAYTSKRLSRIDEEAWKSLNTMASLEEPFARIDRSAIADSDEVALTLSGSPERQAKPAVASFSPF